MGLNLHLVGYSALSSAPSTVLIYTYCLSPDMLMRKGMRTVLETPFLWFIDMIQALFNATAKRRVDLVPGRD
jgi:hypothetical protein